MKIYIASDHTGIEMRKKIIEYLVEKGHEIIDKGTNQESSNYVKKGIRIGESVAQDSESMGIVICGTGVGISVACNKVPSIFCALVDRVENAKLVRQHNNANVLALGARTTSIEDSIKIVEDFVNTDFDGGRHATRLDSLKDYELVHELV